MFLAEDKIRPSQSEPTPTLRVETASLAQPGGKWCTFPNSRISHHGAACCDIAHEWLIAYDFAQLNGGDALSGPRWMRECSSWGPTVWPIHWCEAVGAKVVDCGVHAALAHEVFVARGVTAFRAQFVQRYGADTGASWRQRWRKDGASDHWIDGELIYHEGNAIPVSENGLKLWDGSAGSWINPREGVGYGSLAAVRVDGEHDIGEFHWGGLRIPLNQWVAV